MNINQIMISSEDNPDWNGTWHKNDVVNELRELSLDNCFDADWIEYVINRVLENECPDHIIKVFITNAEIKSIIVNLPSGTVNITKF